MLYLTCTMIADYRISRVKDWVSVDCGTIGMYTVTCPNWFQLCQCCICLCNLKFEAITCDNCSKIFEACHRLSFCRFVISFVFLTLFPPFFSNLCLVQVLSRLSSWHSPARASVSFANRRLVIVLPPILPFPSCSS